jgi:hypothetical protein
MNTNKLKTHFREVMWIHLVKAAHHIVNMEKIPDANKGFFLLHFLFFLISLPYHAIDFDKDDYYIILLEDLCKNLDKCRESLQSEFFYFFIFLFYFIYYCVMLL